MGNLAIEWINKQLKDSDDPKKIYTYENFFKEFNLFSKEQRKEIRIYLSKLKGDVVSRFKEYIYRFENDTDPKKEGLKIEGTTIFDKTTFCSANDLLNMDIPEVEWFIPQMIPKRGITYIGGDSGSLKSFISQHLALCCVGKKKFLNNYPIESDGRPIVYFDEENRLNILKERFGKLKNAMDVDIDDLKELFLIVDSQVKFDIDQKDHVGKMALEKIESKVKELKPQMIVFDSFIRFFQGDENFSTDVRKVFETIKRIMIDNDCGVIILHHTGKNPTTNSKHNLRGSGEISASADVVLLMQHKKQYEHYLLSQEKNRLDEQITPIKVKLDVDSDKAFLKFDGLLDDSPSTIEEIKDTIKKWCLEDNIYNFKTKDAVNYLSKNGYNRTNTQAALSELLADKFLKKLRKGHYEVEEFHKITQEKITDDNLLQQVSSALNKYKEVTFENLQVMLACDEEELHTVINDMKKKGLLFEPKNGKYRLLK